MTPISQKECINQTLNGINRVFCIAALMLVAFGCTAADIPFEGGTGIVINPAADGPFAPCEFRRER